MSYSSKLKSEIMENNIERKDEILAELYGIFFSKNSIRENMIKFSTENIEFAKRIVDNIFKVSGLKAQVKYSIAKRFSKPRIFYIYLYNSDLKYNKFLKKLKEIILHIDDTVILNALLRGYFLATGYIKDPNKGYTLDFFIDTLEASEFLYQIIFKMKKKVFKTKKNNKYLVYIRNSEDILDFINIFGVIKIFFEYEEVTIIKEANNSVNRSMNYELANESKKAEAAIKQIDMIEFIDKKLGLNNLTKALFELSKIRLENEEDSYQELAVKLGISKSGVRNRFRRLEEIYLELKE